MPGEGDDRIVPASQERRWIGLLPVAVFLVSSMLLAYWWSALAAAQGRAMQEHFEVDARRVETKLAERLESYEQVQRGMAGLFGASEHVSREEFRRYVESLQAGNTYGGLQATAFFQWIPPKELAAHEESVRAKGFPDYRVRPEGERDEYTSVVYIEPMEGKNLRAFGTDPFTEPTRRAAMALARDQGQVATTKRVVLAQETGTDLQAGVIIVFPVYAGLVPGNVEERRALLKGWVGISLRMNDFMQQLLAKDLPNVRLEIFDGNATGPENLLYDSGPGSTGPSGLSGLSFSIPLSLHQQAWTLKFTAENSTWPRSGSARPSSSSG